MAVGEFVNEVYVVTFGETHPPDPFHEKGQFVTEVAYIDREQANTLAKEWLYNRGGAFKALNYSDTPHIIFAYQNKSNRVWVERLSLISELTR